jgi:hypothetical protein
MENDDPYSSQALVGREKMWWTARNTRGEALVWWPVLLPNLTRSLIYMHPGTDRGVCGVWGFDPRTDFAQASVRRR